MPPPLLRLRDRFIETGWQGGRRARQREDWLPPDKEAAIFFLRWLRAPHRIGAVAPSSRFLARAMAREVDVQGAGPVVELGGGTGSITRALLDAGLAPDRLIVVERDEHLYRLLCQRFPQVRVLHGDACHLVALLRPLGIDAVSAVVSGLPLMTMPKPVRRQIVEESFALLGESGRFIQFTYTLASPLADGGRGIIGRVAARVWLNLPPAHIWRYRRAA
jgi:phosphatidylethanolamine/phosphatidyl-N-methylethanolamine N-methyltransferase